MAFTTQPTAADVSDGSRRLEEIRAVGAEPEQPVETTNRRFGSVSPEYTLVVAGYSCLAMGLLFLMAVFGLAGLAIGIVNFKRGKSLHGTIQIIAGMTYVLVALVFYATRSVIL